MSQNFGAHVYRVTDITDTITRHATRATDTHPIPQTLAAAMPEFGAVIGDKFVVVVNEAWEDYCPSYEFDAFIERLYGIPDDVRWSFRFPAEYESVNGGANAYDVAEKLGIDLPDEDAEARP